MPRKKNMFSVDEFGRIVLNSANIHESLRGIAGFALLGVSTAIAANRILRSD